MGLQVPGGFVGSRKEEGGGAGVGIAPFVKGSRLQGRTGIVSSSMDQLSFDFSAPSAPAPTGTDPAPPPDPASGGKLADPSRVVQSLVDALRGPPQRTRLVGRTRGEGRELLRQLALRGSPWIGVEPTTLRPLALELVGAHLATEGLHLLDDLEQEALVEAALDGALEELHDSPWAGLAEGVGFRGAVGSTVAALRMAGIRADRVERSAVRDPHRRALLAAVLRRYEEGLRAGSAVDTAGLFHRAVQHVREGNVPDGRVLLLPGLTARGLPGRFAARLLDSGAAQLAADAAEGAGEASVLWREEAANGAPSIQLFRAAGITEEVREVFRRVLAAGVSFDQVEVVTADPVAYGSAFHVEGSSLGVPVTFGVGLPVERTRPGRVAATWFRWLDAGFPASLLRGLLESGDLEPPPEVPADGPRLARRLRLLRVGGGWDRYLPLVLAAQRGADGTPFLRREESREEAEDRQARTREELDGLRRFLDPVLGAVPPPLRVGRGRSPDEGRVSPGELAGALAAFLLWIRPGEGPDATALQRLRQQLSRIATTLVRPTDPGAALRILRRHLRIRVPAPDAHGSAPWMSSGGYLHLTDLEHGGFTGRALTFVVGADADRFGLRTTADPLLPDPDRRLLDPSLPTGADRARETAFRLRAFLARLRGDVTFSYAAWSTGEAREVTPAPVILEQARLLAGRPSLGYEELPAVLGPVRGRIPSPDAALLDDDDVWLQALSSAPGVLREGRRSVLAARPGLRAGVEARQVWTRDELTVHHGRVRPRPGMDPRLNPGLVVSPSALEALGTCGLRYLYRAGLQIRPPSDPEFDPDVWLDPLHRGSLLHRVFERTLREARQAGIPPGAEGPLEELAHTILEQEALRQEREVPPPGDAVRAREMTGLISDVSAFVAQVVRDGAPWEALELRFGPEAGLPVMVPVEGGDIALRGAVDRVDRGLTGLVVIDYKTGGAGRYRPDTGTFHGGRRLQHVLYALAVERLRNEPVESMVYLFPGRRGMNDRKPFSRFDMASGGELVGTLLDLVRDGRLMPTDDPDDCRFCDYAGVCRVRVDAWKVRSPPAEWTRDHLAMEPELIPLRTIRTWEGR